jgi:Cu+-exporting ATPase
MREDSFFEMLVDEAGSRLKSEYMGKTCSFCSPGCKKSFDDGPDKYLSGNAPPMGPEGHSQR